MNRIAFHIFDKMHRRPFHVGCEITGLGICFCEEGTPVHLRDPENAENYCERAEQVKTLWKKETTHEEQPEETQILLPVLYKRHEIGEKTVAIEGLKVAEEEERTARTAAELLASKAAAKAKVLGIHHTLLTDLDIEEPKVDMIDEESVDQKLTKIQRTIEECRQDIRDLDKKKDAVSSDQELQCRPIGQKMATTMEQLETIKDKLPPDRLQEAMVVREMAHGIFAKSRKSCRRHRRLLRKEDITEALIGHWLSVYWPDDNQWWTVFVQAVNPTQSTATLLYETEEAEEVDLQQLVEKGEVAWLEIGGNHGDHHRKKKRYYV